MGTMQATAVYSTQYQLSGPIVVLLLYMQGDAFNSIYV